MGVMTGKVLPNEFVVMDVIPLPVEGTETRVNAMAEGYEYMVNYVTSLNKIGRNENVIGWYHSHPGYGCWLSGIDVNTQRQSQTFQDPFLALVIDPNCTIAAGKVEIGAFRTYPLNSQGRPIKTAEKASSASKIASAAQIKSTKSQAIPSAKIKDFGVHADFYYQLPITYFKSNLDSKLLDLLWNKYWTSTLSQSPLLSNYDYATRQIQENALKTDAATEALARQLNAIHENAAFHISSSLPKPKASSSDSFASATTINSEGIYMEPHSLTSGHSGKRVKKLVTLARRYSFPLTHLLEPQYTIQSDTEMQMSLLPVQVVRPLPQVQSQLQACAALLIRRKNKFVFEYCFIRGNCKLF